MNIVLKVLGFELARIDIALPTAVAVEQVPVLDKGIEVISDWWVRRMLKKHTR